MPELSALTSFTIQNNIIGKDSIKTVQALDLRGKIYALMKKVVGQNPQVVSEEAIQALLHLATVEVGTAFPQSLLKSQAGVIR